MSALKQTKENVSLIGANGAGKRPFSDYLTSSSSAGKLNLSAMKFKKFLLKIVAAGLS